VSTVPLSKEAREKMEASEVFISENRAEARRAQQRLAEATLKVADKLGAGHPRVEEAKRVIQKFRAKEENLRWREVGAWHEANIASAIRHVEDGVAPAEHLETAIRSATVSELGPGAPCVEMGKTRARKLKQDETKRTVQGRVQKFEAMLERLLQGSSLANILEAIEIGARSLGTAHPSVEQARKDYKQKRDHAQKREWDELVHVQDNLMASACATRRPQIKAALQSGVGRSHPVVVDGQKQLLKVRKEALQSQKEQDTVKCERWLKALTIEAERSLKRLEAEVNHKVAMPALE